MLRILLYAICLIFLLQPVALSQQAVRTETASNLAVYRSTAGNDTLRTAKFIVGISLGSFVATDTIEVFSGVYAPTRKAKIAWGATVPYVYNFLFGFRCDSAVIRHTGTSAFTTFYREGW